MNDDFGVLFEEEGMMCMVFTQIMGLPLRKYSRPKKHVWKNINLCGFWNDQFIYLLSTKLSICMFKSHFLFLIFDNLFVLYWLIERFFIYLLDFLNSKLM